jgi:hypothetical protein
MSQAAMDLFGQLLMTRVRDAAISDWTMLIDGRMKGERATRIRSILDRFPDTAKELLPSLVPEIVDSVLHHLLWALEQSDDVSVRVQVGNEDVRNLRDASDGLAGELYSDEGWIARFSKEGRGSRG